MKTSDRILRRKRINKRIGELCKFPISCIYGSSGSGKTTAVKAYMEDNSIQYLYIPLRKGDSDKIKFWKTLCFYAEKKHPELGLKLQKIGFPEDIVWVARLISGIKEYVKTNFIFIFDDAHNIEQNPDITEIIEYIALEESTTFRMMFISRNPPPDNILRLCELINNDEFMFTHDEISDYCILTGLEPDSKTIERIFELSEGFFAAVYVLCLYIKNGFDIFSDTFLTADGRGIIDRTLAKQFTETELNMLIMLSVPEEIPPNLAVLITKSNESLKLLKRLVNSYTFVSFSFERNSYIIHNVFRYYLLKRPDVTQDYINNIMYITGEWYLTTGDAINAVNYCYRSGKIKELFCKINKPDLKILSFRSCDIFYKIMSELDENECINYPFPYIYMIFYCILSGNNEKNTLAIKILEYMESYYENSNESIKNKILGELSVIHMFASFNDIRKMLVYFYKAHNLLDCYSELIGINDPATMGIPDVVYVFLREQGDIPNIEDIALKISVNSMADNFSYCLYPLLKAGILTEECRFDEALEVATQAKYIGTEKNHANMIACAYFTLIRIEIATGKPEKALAMLSEMSDYSVYCEQCSVSALAYKLQCELSKIYVYCCLGMQHMLENSIKDPRKYKHLLMNGMGYQSVLRARASLLKNDSVYSEVLCGIAEKEMEVFHNYIGKLHCQIIKSIIAERRNKNGLDILKETINRASEDNIILLIAEYGNLIKPMLDRLPQNSSEQIKKIKSLCSRYCHDNSVAESALTERETQVLMMMASGLSRNEAASEINVSVSTIKRHIETCYRKLGVNNRVSAINEAKKRGMI